MKLRWAVNTILPVLLVFFLPFVVGAQPMLPAVAGATENGVVLLSWTCQYDGVKTIAVRRSRENGFNYKIIGYVKDLRKGQQAFVDGHPEAGNNYYKLYIVFNSGLSWSSNTCAVFVDSSAIAARSVMLSNDSLQRYLKTESVPVKPLVGFSQGGRDSIRTSSAKERTITLAFDVATADTVFGEDSVAVAPKAVRKISLSFPQPDIDEATVVQSRYVVANKFSGHIEITLPADARDHAYSIRFYNKQGRVQVDIPELKEPFIILDKRNFQRKGQYKFTLRKDGLDFETGYVNVNL